MDRHFVLNVGDRAYTGPIRNRLLSSSGRFTIWQIFLGSVVFGWFGIIIFGLKGAIDLRLTWLCLSGAIVVGAFLMYLSTYCVLLCDSSLICGNRVRRDYLLFSRELEYSAISNVKYEQTDYNRGTISIFTKEESSPLRVYCEYFEEENEIWKSLCEKVSQSVFDSSALERLDEIKDIRVHGPKPFSWKRFFTEPIVRRYGKK